MRAVVFWIHLVLGCAFGLVIAVVAATGALLGFQAELVAGADDVVAAEGPRLPLDVVVQRAAAGRKARVTAVSTKTDPVAPTVVSFAGEEASFVNPRTGEVRRPSRRRRFFEVVEDVHRSLTAGKLGKLAVGVSTIGFFVLGLSGLVLWIPRRWTKKNLRAVSWFRRNLDGKARDFNWHNTIGLWSLVVILALSGSGVVLSFPWAADLVYRVLGEAPPSAPSPVVVARSDAAPLSLDEVLARARVAGPDAKVIAIRLPPKSEKPGSLPAISVTLRDADPLAFRAVTFDPYSGEILRDETRATRSRGQRARVFLRFLHTGQVYGLPGQALATLASLGTLVLVWTGLALAWRRLVRRR